MVTPVEELIKLYRTRYAALSNLRAQQLPIWQDIRDYIAPRTARFPGEQITNSSREDLKIINTAPRIASRTLASGMQSGITSPMRPWFRLGTPDPELQEFKPVKVWLSDVERILRDILGRSNLYDRLKSNYGTLGNYGTSAMFIEEDEEDIIRGYDYLIGTFMIAADSTGRVDTMYRDTELTTIQMVQKFGLDRIPDVVRTYYNNGNYEQLYTVCHIVEPNRNYRPGSALSQYKAYSSVWFDPAQSGEKAILRISGYDNKPVMAPRWDVVGERSWGIGCGELVLGDAKQLQVMEKKKLRKLALHVDPNMLADSSMRNKRTTNLPGETSYVNNLTTGNPGYRPSFQVDSNLGDIQSEIERVERRIEEGFFKNFFLMVAEFADQPNITATQINTLREEKLMMLGPVLERLNDELLDPMIDVVFNICQRRGVLPPPPEEIQGMPLKIEYISVLAQAQKALGIGNIERFLGFVMNYAQVDPMAMDKVNRDHIIEEYAEGVAIPPESVNTDEEAGALRQERAQAQAQQAMAEQGVASSQVLKNLSQSGTSGDNVLSKALEAAGAA